MAPRVGKLSYNQKVSQAKVTIIIYLFISLLLLFFNDWVSLPVKCYAFLSDSSKFPRKYSGFQLPLLSKSLSVRSLPIKSRENDRTTSWRHCSCRIFERNFNVKNLLSTTRRKDFSGNCIISRYLTYHVFRPAQIASKKTCRL